MTTEKNDECIVVPDGYSLCKDCRASLSGAEIEADICDACRDKRAGDNFCRADLFGYNCHWSECPQKRDGEPKGTGRPCPYFRTSKLKKR